ncbi:MAG: hypothetical protein ACREV0_11780 [Burkholderiales bacterium]
MKQKLLPQSLGLLSLAGSLFAATASASDFCTRTAEAAFRACTTEAAADRYKTDGICINVSDEEEREDCFEDAAKTRSEETALCGKQRTSRLALCKVLGEGRYDPDFDPSLFDKDFASLTHPNRYFPLTIGHKWEYAGGDETVTIEVLQRTKLIEGVTCIVVNDQAFVGGELVENTDDWFAHATNGDVYYCGEEVKDFESFDGDQPKLPELVSIDGSFKAGRDGDKPGIIFLANPKKGAVYRQEFSLANAEDFSQVLSTAYSFGSDSTLDQFVPRALARMLCERNCIVTKESNPNEPGTFEHKYYALDIGFFLAVNLPKKETLQLVNCNFDHRCRALPKP